MRLIKLIRFVEVRIHGADVVIRLPINDVACVPTTLPAEDIQFEIFVCRGGCFAPVLHVLVPSKG